MSLKMANGDEVTAWHVQAVGSDGSVGSAGRHHDRKMSGSESMAQNQQQQHHVVASGNGTGEAFSIVKQETDRRGWPNLQSSERFGDARFHGTTTTTTTTPGTDVSPSSFRVDTTNAAASSSSFRHHLTPLDSSTSQNQQQQELQSIADTDSYDNTHLFLSNAFSDYHLEPTSLTAGVSNNNQDWNSTSGTREARFDSESSASRSSAIDNNNKTNSSNISNGHPRSGDNRITITETTPNTATPPAATATTLTQEARRNTGSTSDDTTRMGYNELGDHSNWALENSKMDGTHEGKNRDGDDSTVQSTAVLSTGSIHGDGDHLSPASTPRMGPSAGPTHESEGGNPTIGTPSTVSTAPSTEEASLSDTIDRIGLNLDPNQLEPFTLHRRAPSWDRSPMTRNLYANTEISASHMQPTVHQIPSTEQSQQQYWGLPQQQHQTAQRAAQAYPSHQQQPQHLSSSPWGNPQSQSRIASFRSEQAGVPDSTKHDSRAAYSTFAQIPNPNHHAQAEQQQRGWHHSPQHPGQLPYHQLQQQQPQQGRPAHMQQQEGMGYRHSSTSYNPYHVQQHQSQRKSGFPPQHQQPPTAQSPARTARAGRGTPGGPSPHRPQSQAGGGPPSAPSAGTNSRSSSEILKTLLRKKACLYEPDTSRAVALVTWLVGRVLALEYGYFSRQQLQAGVHACVAEKIDSGTITRTKVNRCMQIILNSCFHYIIPRPDGTEEKGHLFRDTFQKEAYDDSTLLDLLPEPWNDLHVGRQTVLDAADGDHKSVSEPRSAPGTPHSSPRIKPKEAPRPSPKRDKDVRRPSPDRERDNVNKGHGDHGDDSKRAVLLCFNENVRSAEDVFRCHNEFIRDSAHSSNLQLTAQEWRIFFGREAAETPHIWGNVGIPVVAVESSTGERKVDVLGQMTHEEAGKFRTTWCAKRYDHDHEFCGMAHVEVSGGWLRRNPNLYQYKDEFCPSVIKTVDKRIGPNYFVINECPKGVECEFAHSYEELVYHPKRYKNKPCSNIMRTGTCRYGDICPHHHPSDSARPPKKGDSRPPNPRHNRSGGQSSTTGKNTTPFPTGSPILYASPAPVSSYEIHLHMPGLQNLFRRQCSVVRAHLRNPKCRCCYSYFGDDIGVDQDTSSIPSAPPVGLPSHRM